MKIILLMILGHLVADYTLQGVLANMKQIGWWKKALEDVKPERRRKYRYDWIVALACHSLYWSIISLLPLYESPLWAHAVMANAVLHGIVDDLKANRCAINLWQDQSLHLTQIVATYFVV